MPKRPRCLLARVAILSSAALLLAGCAAGLPSGGAVAAGTYSQSVDTGVSRHFLVHVPEGYDPGRPLPLVIAVHGAFDSAEQLEQVTGLSALADRAGFVVAYPNGLGLLGFLRHWNAGFCCAKAKHDGWDDTGFLLKLIDDLSGRLAIDRDRVALVGFSNGGMLAYRFAAEHPGRIAALAVAGAAIGGQESEEPAMATIPDPMGPLPVLIMHARDDDSIPFAGGPSPRHPEISYLGPVDAAALFVRVNRCAGEPERRELPGHEIRRWGGCAAGSEVVFAVNDSGGHAWPRRRADRGGFEATELVADFLGRWLADR